MARVRGYPQLQTDRPQGTSAQLGQGRVDLADVRPALLAGLEKVGEQLGRTLTIFSGFRTDAYSQQVGGFAGDPHTQGIAADVNVGSTPIGNVPRALRLLRAQGLVSGAQPGFYRGQPDPAHVQLPAGAGSPSTSLETLWIEAGGKPALARVMAAIALAESGGNAGAQHTNSDGSVDRGLWQVNSSHTMYDPGRLLSDPLYNAKAAVAIQRSQGLGAWTTYTSGAYRQYLDRAGAGVVSGVTPGTPGRVRPGGGTGADGATAQDAAWYDYLYPHGPSDLLLPGSSSLLGDSWNPLDIFKSGANAITDVASFLKWVAWIFHPRNLLRIVEFTAGAGLMGLGLWTSVKAFEGQSQAPAPARRVQRVLDVTPQGRALGVARAAREGRKAARTAHRASARAEARSKARKAEATRLSNRTFERNARRGPTDEIPF